MSGSSPPAKPAPPPAAAGPPSAPHPIISPAICAPASGISLVGPPSTCTALLRLGWDVGALRIPVPARMTDVRDRAQAHWITARRAVAVWTPSVTATFAASRRSRLSRRLRVGGRSRDGAVAVEPPPTCELWAHHDDQPLRCPENGCAKPKRGGRTSIVSRSLHFPGSRNRGPSAGLATVGEANQCRLRNSPLNRNSAGANVA